MSRIMDEIKHLLEEGEELLMSIFDDGHYHVLTYNKAFNTLFYFLAYKSKVDHQYVRAHEEILTSYSLKDKLSKYLTPEAIEFLEKVLLEKSYAT